MTYFRNLTDLETPWSNRWKVLTRARTHNLSHTLACAHAYNDPIYKWQLHCLPIQGLALCITCCALKIYILKSSLLRLCRKSQLKFRVKWQAIRACFKTPFKHTCTRGTVARINTCKMWFIMQHQSQGDMIVQLGFLITMMQKLCNTITLYKRNILQRYHCTFCINNTNHLFS